MLMIIVLVKKAQGFNPEKKRINNLFHLGT